MYKDSVPDHIDQAAILEDVYFYAIDAKHLAYVLTPTCDIANDKADFIQVCAILPAWQVVQNIRTYGSWAKKSDNEVKGEMSSLIGQRVPRYHWFAPWQGIDVPYIADFQLTVSQAFKEIKSNRILAALSSPYAEQVSARYSAYMGRVGTPNLTDIAEWVRRSMYKL